MPRLASYVSYPGFNNKSRKNLYYESRDSPNESPGMMYIFVFESNISLAPWTIVTSLVHFDYAFANLTEASLFYPPYQCLYHFVR